MLHSRQIGSDLYEVVVRDDGRAPFTPATGVVRLLRNSKTEASWSYDSASERRRFVAEARDRIPSSTDTYQWSPDAEYASSWHDGPGLAHFVVAVRDHGADGPVTGVWNVVANTASEAVFLAERDNQERHCYPGAVIGPAYLSHIPSNPSPPYRDGVKNVWAMGPHGWDRYDLTERYIGPTTEDWKVTQ